MNNESKSEPKLDSKHYLKWEDLEFKKEWQSMKVIYEGHVYTLCYHDSLISYYESGDGYTCGIINSGITIWPEWPPLCKRDFFNDLHLERA